ncbi:hypothetical protein I7I50_06762 [Histoplasma capsulatum G186AR]|uniref:Uncharacterized protein n=1 Tax=Ajellomyces capsulatus TaxID=5037 RepID=A0A8H8D4R9_AJECA|nr:hypothetical protein I7I52_10164 [Histoplasma capsulatum]QSS67625.1 hypothetical protein I7I50_06762 [Histoplasma capsulatum G186AR]
MCCTIYKHHGPPKVNLAFFFLSELAGFRRLAIFPFSFSFLFPPSNSNSHALHFVPLAGMDRIGKKDTTP